MRKQGIDILIVVATWKKKKKIVWTCRRNRGEDQRREGDHGERVHRPSDWCGQRSHRRKTKARLDGRYLRRLWHRSVEGGEAGDNVHRLRRFGVRGSTVGTRAVDTWRPSSSPPASSRSPRLSYSSLALSLSLNVLFFRFWSWKGCPCYNVVFATFVIAWSFFIIYFFNLNGLVILYNGLHIFESVNWANGLPCHNKDQGNSPCTIGPPYTARLIVCENLKLA